MIVFLLLFLFYVLFIFWLSFKAQRVGDMAYLMADRQIGLWSTLASLTAGLRDGGGISVWVFVGIAFGLGGLMPTIGAGLGLGLLGFLAPKIYSRARAHKMVTVNDWLSSSYGAKTEKLSGAIVLWFSFFYAVANLFVGGTILSIFLGTPPMIGMLIVALLCFGYLFIGGYRNVVLTDVFQWVLLFLVFLAPLFLPFKLEFSAVMQQFLSMDYNFGAFLGVLLFLIFFSSPDVWQRIFSAKSGFVARKALWFSAPVYIFLTVGLLFFGMVLSQNMTITDPQDAFFVFFETSFLGAWGLGLIGLMAIAGLMSTFDTQVFLFASTWCRNFTNFGLNLEKAVRLVLALTLLAMFLMAQTIGNLIEFFFSSTSIITVLFPVLLFSVFIKKMPDWVSVSALLVGIATYFYFFFSGTLEETLSYNLVPALLTLAVLSVGVYWSRRFRG